ncbi:MAG: hypothetical protein V2J62_05020 [candidate division KSB1 bacterium]|nr:hypothetical protein [candidate division KSB1 bacterium]
MIRLFLFACFLVLNSAFAQDSNIVHPLERIERALWQDDFKMNTPRGVRYQEDQARWTMLRYDDGFFMRVKIMKAPKGGGTTNNNPRYELAAYQFQKLFLDPHEYVVPPVSIRFIPIEYYRKFEPDVKPTFRKTDAVLCAFQYWLSNVSPDDLYNEKRLEEDSLYAKHIANFNIFTYLVQHNDSNEGNALISTDVNNPRVFSVDNGLTFGEEYSRLGVKWRDLFVPRLPETTIDRLRTLDYDSLFSALSVIAQYRIQDGSVEAMEPTSVFDKYEGVRVNKEMIQFGLTESEIYNVYNRLRSLLKMVDKGKIPTF